MNRSITHWMLRKCLIIASSLFLPTAFGSSGITYHGRLLKPNNSPVTSAAVQFRLQVRTPGTEDCLMYEEIQTLDLSSTSGVFSLSLADGSGSRQDSYSWSLFEAFSNRKSFTFNSSDCIGSNTYTPNASDNRHFKVYFNDGSFTGWEALPVQTINFIPMSIESYAVGGFPASSLFRVEDSGTLGNVSALTTTQYNNLVSLANGTSSTYEKFGELGGSALPTLTNGQTMVSNGSGGWSASTPLTSESDPNVSAFAKTSLPTCNAGEVLTASGGNLSCVTDTSGTLPNVGTAGTYTKVTTDAQGRVTSGSQITGSDITSGTIGGSTAVNTSGNIQSSAEISAGRFKSQEYLIYDSSNTNYVTLKAPTVGTNYDLVLPPVIGTSNQILGFNDDGDALENKSLTAGTGVTITHSAGGIEISATGSGGTVTSVTGTAPIQVATGTSTPVISVDDASTTAKGVVKLADDGGTDLGTVVQANDSRLSSISGKLDDDLAEGKVFVGNSSDKAEAKNFGIGDLKTLAGTSQWPTTSCTSGQTLTWSSITDALSCTSIGIAANQITSGTIDTARLGSGTADSTTYLRGDGTWVSVGGGAAGGSSGQIQFNNSGSLDGSTSLVWDNTNSRLGIGIASPTYPLDVSGFSRSTAFMSATAGNAANPAFRIGGGAGTGIFGTSSLSFATGGSERMTITNAGNVGIGTDSPSSLLEVDGVSRLNSQVIAGSHVTLSNSSAMLRFRGSDPSVTSPAAHELSITTNSTERLRIDSNGNVGIGTTSPSEKLQVNGNVLATSYLYTSDRRYKKDIEDIEGLESILKLRGVHFRWKENGKPEMGLIAQEVEKVLPELVVTNPVTGMKSVKYGNLVAPLIESVKELNRKISSIKKENSELKARMERVEFQNQMMREALCELNPKAEICWNQ